MLSHSQVDALKEMHYNDYREFYMFPYCGRNKPSWKLVEMGLAVMDFGPKDSWLKTYCFMPLWIDPIC